MAGTSYMLQAPKFTPGFLCCFSWLWIVHSWLSLWYSI